MEYFEGQATVERVGRVLKERLTAGAEDRGELEEIIDEVIGEGRPGVGR